VGMGELAVTADASGVLTTIGLGSCVGIVLVDPADRRIGLGHVIFPRAPKRAVAEPGKYADTAVATLIAALARLGSPCSQLVAVLVGGARMFSFERPLNIDVGASNLAVIREALGAAQIPIRVEATGGSIGRSVRAEARDGVVSVRSGSAGTELYRVTGSELVEGALR